MPSTSTHNRFAGRPLREACQEDRFRWDLFYRLSVAELHVLTLAERGQAEKRELIDYFLRSKQHDFRRAKRLTLSAATYRMLDSYQFPGNVRELENLVESLYVFAGDKVDVADLPDWLSQPTRQLASFDWSIHEKALIQKALTYFAGNKARACNALGYGSINTLVSKMKLYRIDLV